MNLLNPISDRERQVLHMVAFEKTSQEIAQELFISNHTVITHRQRLMEKLDVRNTAGLVRRGFELGLLRVAICIVFFTSIGGVQLSAQVSNDDEINYQVNALWVNQTYALDPNCCGINEETLFGLEEPVWRIAACPDDGNGVASAIISTTDPGATTSTCGDPIYCYDGGQTNCEDGCFFFITPAAIGTGAPVVVHEGATTLLYDVEFWAYENDDVNSMLCTVESGSQDATWLSKTSVLRNVKTDGSADPSVWGASWTISKDVTLNNVSFIHSTSLKTAWRYTNGTKANPLQFGTINGSKFHVNSNRSKPAGGDVRIGYDSDWTLRPGNDVTYTFVIADVPKKVTIDLDPPPFSNTSWSNVTYLLEGTNPNPIAQSLSSTSYSDIIIDLCPGTYTIVVEGVQASNQGAFQLNVSTAALSLNPGTVSTSISSVCEGAPFNITTTESIAHGNITGGNLTYQWESKLSNQAQWTEIQGKTSNALELSNQTMDSIDVQYRRKLDYCGLVVYSNILTVESIANSINGGTIQYPINNLYIKKGSFAILPVVNDVFATGSPTPISYKWIKEKSSREDTLNNGQGGLISNGEIYSMSLDASEPPGEQSDFDLSRIATNGCGVTAESNKLEFKVLAANGSIAGKVSAPAGGSPIRGVSVCATVDTTFGDVYDRAYAGVSICDTTDAFGDYKIENLYTGNPNNPGVRYNVRPTFLDHVFKKPIASAEGGDSIHVVTLINNNQVESKNFEDLTVISVQGNVYHDFNANEFGKKGVAVYAEQIVSGIAVPTDSTTTDENGDYALALPNPGEYIIRPEFKKIIATGEGPVTQEHTFMPEMFEKTFITDTIINFVDQSYEKIVIRFGGACDRDIGSCRIYIIDRDKNNNIHGVDIYKTVTNGFTEYLVPARDYDIDILNIGYDPAGGADDNVVNQQLISMPNDSAIVAFSVDSITISIREKPEVVMSGFENYIDESCAVGTGVYDLPILEQHKLYPDINVDIYEGPTDGGCPLDTGTLQVVVGIQTLPALSISNGKAEDFLLKGGFPNFNGDYSMNMTVSATDIENQSSEQLEQRFITTGSMSKGTDFLSLSPELPFLVLHDPPTDGGTAFWEANRGFSTTSSTYMNHSEGGGASTKLQIGGEFENGFDIFGVTFAFETKIFATGDGDISANQTTNSSESTNITTTINERIDTDPGEDFIGDDADIVMTMIMAKTFAESDILAQEGCDIELTTAYALSKDSIAAISYRTIRDIREVIIPDLDSLLQKEPDPEKTKGFEFSIQQWRDIIAANEAEKQRVFADTPADSIRNIAIGSGVSKSYSESRDSAYTSSFEYIMEVSEEFGTGASLLIMGNGGEGRVYGQFRQEFTIDPSIDTENSQSITTGYTLYDEDQGDQYLIGVYEDSRYGTPMFNVLAGSSSCPYVAYSEEEPLVKTKAFSVVPVTSLDVKNVNPTTGTTFQFEIFNHSDDDENFRLTKNFAFGQSSEVKINSSLDNEISIPIAAGQSSIVLVAVNRSVGSGPDDETIKIRIAPDCGGDFEGNNELSLTLKVGYVSTISPITISDPTQVVNIASENILKIKMTDYVKADFDDLGLQYTSQGFNSLKDANNFKFTSDSLKNDAALGTIKDWDLSEIQEDGLYEIKLKTTKDEAVGSNGSNIVSILIDRQKPIVFGVPEPVDDQYDQAANDIISVSYNENVQASTGGVMVEIENLVTGEVIPATATIFQNRVKIVDNTALNTLPSSAYRVTLSGIEDMVGNPADVYRWVFLVGDYNNIDLSCISELFIGNNNLNQNSINVNSYRARLINSDGVIDGYGTTSYMAQEAVNLDEGFEVTTGGIFEANIEECTGGGN